MFEGAALWSFIGIIASLAVLVLGFLFMKFCYFPGGYKRSDVMDIGEYAMFVAQIKHEERKKKQEEKEEKEYVDQYDELYHERDDYDDEDEKSRRGGGGADWRSEATSEQDLEGGSEYYDGASADGRSAISPTSTSMTPSQRGGLKPALKPGRDDQSESTYTSGSGSGAGTYY